MNRPHPVHANAGQLAMILVIDNYDSFVHNLARYFRQLECDTQVVRNDSISIAEIEHLNPSAIVLSPGPCSPDQAGICLQVIEQFQASKPILGVCLGHQAIIQAFGGKIIGADEPMHGRSSQVEHSGSPMFNQVQSPFKAARYHSLVGQPKTVPDCLTVTAKTADQTVMAVEHKTLPMVGLQFHPESVLTDCGYRLISNFLTLAKIEHARLRVDQLHQDQVRSDSRTGDRDYPVSDRLSTNLETS